MRYLVSAGEPSGDLHARNLIHALSALDPRAHVIGFGGAKMRETGARLIAPLADEPIFGLWRGIAAVPRMLKLLRHTRELLSREPVDAIVLIDYPGFHWRLARIGKDLGIPVFYHVPPQIWSWGSWRVERMRRDVDRVLCALPFEEVWYQSRGVRHSTYVGHPFFDDLAQRTCEDAFVAAQRRDPRPIVALLPGSRTSEVVNNFPAMVRSAIQVQQQVPKVRFLVAGHKESQRPLLEQALDGMDLDIEVHVGRTPEIQRLAAAAICVSGSVSLELMYHAVPTAIVYHIGHFEYHVLRPLLLHTPYITLVNLIAGRQVYPEFWGPADHARDAGQVVIDWLTDESKRQNVVHALRQLTRVYGTPGATRKAAQCIVDDLALRHALPRAG